MVCTVYLGLYEQQFVYPETGSSEQSREFIENSFYFNYFLLKKIFKKKTVNG